MRSLRVRLLLACALILAGFLLAGGIALERAFERAALQAQNDRLTGLVYGLLGAADQSADGDMLIFAPDLPDPRFREPESGLEAAIINAAGKPVWRSPGYREELPLPAQTAVGTWEFRRLNDADRFSAAFGLRWLGLDAEAREYTVVVYESSAAYSAQLQGFRQELWLWFVAVALALSLAMVAALNLLMRPIAGLTDKLQRIEQGTADAIDGEFPSELEPLVGALNTMISGERTQLKRHRNALADVAHSLKTPLAVLRGSQDAQAAAARDPVIDEQLQRMQTIIDYQLGRASRAGRRMLTPLISPAPVIERVVAAMRKVHGARGLNIALRLDTVPPSRIDQGDLFELCGNLIENAARLAQSNVRVSLSAREQQLQLSIEDDGPGFPADARRLLERGQRADTRHPGQGIGLSVADELTQAYDGSLTLGQSQALGGARVDVELPLR